MPCPQTESSDSVMHPSVQCPVRHHITGKTVGHNYAGRFHSCAYPFKKDITHKNNGGVAGHGTVAAALEFCTEFQEGF